MSPEQVALELINWAKSHNMLGGYDIEPAYNDTIINETFRHIGVRNATSILQDRRISYVGINNEKNSVIIFIEKNMRIKDIKTLSGIKFQNVSVEFRHSSIAGSGHTPPPPPVSAYSTLPSGHYTCGSSIYIANHRGAGTLGCLLTDSNGDLYGLSNNHVLADVNYAEMGLPIGVPGLIDVAANGIDPFTVGHLKGAIPLQDGSPSIVPCKENIDAAIFKISDAGKIRLSSMQRNHYDTPTTVALPSGNMKVRKVGRTTGLTTGTIVAKFPTPVMVQAEVAHINSKKIIFFENVWGIVGDHDSQFSSGGDSGSLITTMLADGSQAAVGLLFAGSDALTFMVDIKSVLGALSLELAANVNC